MGYGHRLCGGEGKENKRAKKKKKNLDFHCRRGKESKKE